MAYTWQLPDSTSAKYSWTISESTHLDHLGLEVTNILAALIDSVSEIDQDLFTIRECVGETHPSSLDMKKLFVEIINRLKHHRDCLAQIRDVVIHRKQTK